MYASIRKHMFYGTILLLMFMGSLAGVFRNDFEAKVVNFICVAILTAICLISYINSHKRLW